jgi:threonine aldolase
MVERLADDHRTAKQLADGLHRIAPGLVDPTSIATNIVRVDTTVSGWPAETWSATLQARNVRVSPGGPMQLRFVTHRHISSADVETTLQTFRDLWREAPGQPRTSAGEPHPSKPHRVRGVRALTQPTAEMLDAMSAARLGDD